MSNCQYEVSSPTWCEELTHWKRPWCWERLKAGGEGDNRGWDGWMASLTQWTWVWASSRSWWWTGKPGMMQSMGSQSLPVGFSTPLTAERFMFSSQLYFSFYEFLIRVPCLLLYWNTFFSVFSPISSLYSGEINPLSLSLFIVDFGVKKLNYLYSQNLSIFPFMIFPL